MLSRVYIYSHLIILFIFTLNPATADIIYYIILGTYKENPTRKLQIFKTLLKSSVVI